MSNIPAYVRSQLPSHNLSVNEFLTVSLLPYASGTARFMRVKKYISEQPPNISHIDNVGELLSPPADIVTELQLCLKKGSVTSVLCPHLPLTAGTRYPLWVIELWTDLLVVRNIQENWKKAVNQLEEKLRTAPTTLLIQQAANALAHLPWTGNLLGYHNTIDLSQLWVYFTQEWLSDNHLLVMQELLTEDISRECHRHAFIEDTHFMSLLTTAYRNQQSYATERSFAWIRDRGNQLASGHKTCLTTIVNQHNVHWVALILDFHEKKIQYGDSTGRPMEHGLQEVVEWWVFHHTGLRFAHESLVIGLQHDSYSCGMLAWDALHYRLGGPSVTRMDPSQPSNERLKVFLRLVKHHKIKQVSVSSCLTCYCGLIPV